MFGTNPIRSKEVDPTGRLAITSIFNTIQGEGPYSGMPAVFIRLAGCNLACVFCDTEFEVGIDNRLTVNEIIEQVAMVSTRPINQTFVVITGGEPLRQNIVPLIEKLLSSGVSLVQIETAGPLWQVGMEALINSGRVVLVCSPKTPGINPWVAKYCNHWKYVVQVGRISEEDGLPNVGVQPNTVGQQQPIYRPNLKAPQNVIWVSPCDEHDDSDFFGVTPDQDPVPDRTSGANQKLAVALCLKYGYRLSLQTHKIIGVE